MTKKEQEELKKQNSLYKKVKEASDKKTKEIRFWERRAEHWGRLKADKDRELDKMAVELRHSQALCALLLEKLGGETEIQGSARRWSLRLTKRVALSFLLLGKRQGKRYKIKLLRRKGGA